MPVVNYYTALLSGSYWNGIEATGKPVIVTFSFPTSLPAYDAAIAGASPPNRGELSGLHRDRAGAGDPGAQRMGGRVRTDIRSTVALVKEQYGT